MTTFERRIRSTATVPAPRPAIWKALADPDVLADLTPLVAGIDAHPPEDGRATWDWHLAGIRALGICVSPTFREAMTFDEGRHIGFRPLSGAAGATGTYDLRDVDVDGSEGTELSIDITITVDLPLPRLARGAVEKVMEATMARTGDRFARNLYERLGLDPADAVVPMSTA
jgi:carbon monoxide dehydrogenase subunit G